LGFNNFRCFGFNTNNCLCFHHFMVFNYKFWNRYGKCFWFLSRIVFPDCSFTSIGIFTSLYTDNQIVAFLVSVFLCFMIYFGFDALATILSDFSNYITPFGIDYHYNSISRGVVDTRDLFYFISIIFLFLYLSKLKLNKITKWFFDLTI